MIYVLRECFILIAVLIAEIEHNTQRIPALNLNVRPNVCLWLWQNIIHGTHLNAHQIHPVHHFKCVTFYLLIEDRPFMRQQHISFMKMYEKKSITIYVRFIFIKYINACIYMSSYLYVCV